MVVIFEEEKAFHGTTTQIRPSLFFSSFYSDAMRMTFRFSAIPRIKGGFPAETSVMSFCFPRGTTDRIPVRVKQTRGNHPMEEKRNPLHSIFAHSLCVYVNDAAAV